MIQLAGADCGLAGWFIRGGVVTTTNLDLS